MAIDIAIVTLTTLLHQRSIIYESLQGPVPVITAAETVTVDKWFSPLATPQIRRKVREQPPALSWAAYPVNVPQAQTFSLPQVFRSTTIYKALHSPPVQPAAPGTNDTRPDQWHRLLSEPVRAKPRQQPSANAFSPAPVAAATPGNGDVLVSGSLTTVIHQRSIVYESLHQPITQPSAETVTLDKWYRSFADPTLRKIDPSRWPSLFASPTLPTVPGVDTWHRQFAGPARRKPAIYPDDIWTPFVQTAAVPTLVPRPNSPQIFRSTIIYRDLFEPVVQIAAEVVTLDKWFASLSIPTRRKVDISSWPSYTWTPQTIAEVVTLDKWYQALAGPTRPKVDLSQWPAFIGGPALSFTVAGPDAWQRQFAEPTRRKLTTFPDGLSWTYFVEAAVVVPIVPRSTSPQIFRSTIIYRDLFEPIVETPAETVTLDKWYSHLNTPTRRKPTIYPDALAWGYFFGAVAETVTVDKWYAPLHVPARRKADISRWQAFVGGPLVPIVAEVVTLDKWYRPLAGPVIKASLPVAQQHAFLWTIQPLPGTNDTRPDQWLRSLSVPTLRIRTVYPDSMSWGVFTPASVAPSAGPRKSTMLGPRRTQPVRTNEQNETRDNTQNETRTTAKHNRRPRDTG